jgi:hypothetical protein
MDPATVSAFAACGAATVALLGATFQFFIGRKQAQAALMSATAALKNAENSGRQKIADSRQNWINNVIDGLSQYHAIVTTLDGDTADARKLAELRTKLTILLNPDEADTVALLTALDGLGDVSDQDFAAAEAEMLAVSRRLLKREWVRIKERLGEG